MSVFLITNSLRGVTGLDKSTVLTANLLDSMGVDTHILAIDTARYPLDCIRPKFPLRESVKKHSLKTLFSEKRSNFHYKTVHAFSEKQRFLNVRFSKYELSVVGELIDKMDENDLVIFTHPLHGVLFDKSGKKLRARSLLQIHGNYFDETHNLRLLKECIHSVDYIQVVAPSMITDLAPYLQIPESKFVYIPNIHIPCKIPPRTSSQGEFIVSIIGSLQERKNQLDAVRAVARLSDMDLKLHIWGGGLSSGYFEKVEGEIEERGLTSKVVFRGFGSEEEIYGESDLVIMTSVSEGYGYPILEAASHGIPVVLYDFKYGPRDFVKPGENGYIVPLGDVDELADKIRLLATDTKLYAKISENIKATFDHEFSEGAIFNLYSRFIGDKEKTTDLSCFEISTKEPIFEHVAFTRKYRCGFHLYDEIKVKLVSSFSKSSLRLEKFFEGGADDVDYFFSGSEITATIRSKGLDRLVEHLKSLARVTLNQIAKRIFKRKHAPVRYLHRLTPRPYGLYLKSDLEYFYLCNTKKNGQWAIQTDFLECYPRTPSERLLSSMVVTSNGVILRYPKYAIISSVKNEKGQSLEFSTVFYKAKEDFEEPHVKILGEFKKLRLLFNNEEVVVEIPDRSLREITEKVQKLEDEHGLLELDICGVKVWELVRAPLIDRIMEAHGNWGGWSKSSAKTKNVYGGSKSLDDIKGDPRKRLVFEFPRKPAPDFDPKTYMLQDEKSVVIEYPQEEGFSERSFDEASNIYPIYEFLKARSSNVQGKVAKSAILHLNEVFSSEFGFSFDMKSFVLQRINKFQKEYSFWSEFFRTRKFKEVIIPSAYWSAGIVKAAKDNGVETADVQYALIGALHPNYGFSGRKEYTTDKIYLWSGYWAIPELPYRDSCILERNKVSEMLSTLECETEFDVCVVSQTRLRQRIEDFTCALASQYRNKKIILALHPEDRLENSSKVCEFGNVTVVSGKTLEYIARSCHVVGVFSTSMYEAAALGKTCWVVPFPGYELLEREFSGAFKLLGKNELPDISSQGTGVPKANFF